jgi:hypothetical protein
MSAVVLRILVFLVIAGFIYFGVRRIYRDWTGAFRAEDKRLRERDLTERKRADVIELKRDKDGIYRPGDDDGKP